MASSAGRRRDEATKAARGKSGIRMAESRALIVFHPMEHRLVSIPVPRHLNAAMVALPHDVHVEIIKWVYRNSQHVDIDYRTLSACSLVCKIWTTPAQRLLFRCISPRDAVANLRKIDQLLPVLQRKNLLGTLRCLEMYESFYFESDIPPPVPLKLPQGVNVNWNYPTLAGRLLEGTDTSALRELEMSTIEWDYPPCVDALTSTSMLKNLSSLVLLDGALPPWAILDRCARLETLVFAVRPAIAVVLPRTLTHVGYHAITKDDRLPLRFLVEALKALPSLGLVTATRELSPADVADLTRGCKEIGADFVVLSDYRMFRRMQNVDWI
ncbi:hypothetical protein FA95DRAFT_1611947 [Auriscalpium vulgare]|uniref:Uncharacterized protein n=1 Tax=Auriscalpium vulgare TaxID=40419 RepID=A0ACB8R8L9_9AGAM|nr:hypothetical protein FA95DRAFT_1611947 [Auriscalpium vulgare]